MSHNDLPYCAPTVIDVKKFGAIPDSGTNAVLAVQAAIQAAQGTKGAVILHFEKGRYDFYRDNAVNLSFHITNTTSEKECPDITKYIGIYLHDRSNLILEGNDSFFVFHGKMTSIMLDQTENVEIRNIHIDYERPTVSEMKVTSIGDHHIDFNVNHDSWYEINEGRLTWLGEGFRYTGGPSQECDPEANVVWRSWNPAFEADRVEPLAPYSIRCFYDTMPFTKPGNIFQMRDGIRDQVGIFIRQSKNTSLHDVSLHFAHGLGIVGQHSENLYLKKMNFTPRPSSGRTVACFADFVQMSGCKGQVSIIDSRFSGAHDDVINIHGAHLLIEKIDGNQLTVRFMQSYGFDSFFPGDEVDFVDSMDLNIIGTGRVKAVEKLSEREIRLFFDKSIPKNVAAGDVIENATWTPEVFIQGNYFEQIPTRGILVTTRRKVLIENNTFYKTQLGGILIADDARSWYESGMVTDVSIIENTFVECSEPVINIAPENEKADPERPVHRNIRIERNHFTLSEPIVLRVKSVKGLTFKGNTIASKPAMTPIIEMSFCKDTSISDNVVKGEHELQIKKKRCV